MIPLVAIAGLVLLARIASNANFLSGMSAVAQGGRWPAGTNVLVMPPPNGKWPDGSVASRSVRGTVIGPDSKRSGYYRVDFGRARIWSVPEALLRYDGG